MDHTLVLFDIDGTIMLSDRAGSYAMAAAGRKLFGDTFCIEGAEFAGMLDPVIFRGLAEKHNIEHRHHDDFRDTYFHELRSQLMHRGRHMRFLPGISETITQLRPRGDVMLGLVSGNYTNAVPIKFDAVGLNADWFTIRALGDEADTRPDLVALAMRRYEEQTGCPPRPDRTIIVGDTPRNVKCAHAHGCIAFTVATGPFSVDELREAGADVVCDDLSDPAALFELIDKSNEMKSC